MEFNPSNMDTFSPIISSKLERKKITKFGRVSLALRYTLLTATIFHGILVSSYFKVSEYTQILNDILLDTVR